MRISHTYLLAARDGGMQLVKGIIIQNLAIETL